jgi:hypothetical protein
MIVEMNQALLEYSDKYPLWGILLFTEAHPHVIKTLKDTDYYNALNELSGEHIAILATMLFRGKHTSPQIRPSAFGDLIPIWEEPNKNKEILSLFDVEDSRELPLFILFIIEDGKLYYQKYPLGQNSSEDVFNSLKTVLTLIPNDKHIDKRELYKRMQWNINKLKTTQTLKKIFNIVSMFRGVSGL